MKTWKTRAGAREPAQCSNGIREALATWALLGAAALAVLVTYARLDPAVLYHTSRDGLAGGAGRTLVFLNFPTALAAVGVLAFASAALLPRRRTLVALASPAALVLCLLVAVPGVVDQDDLDAKPVNALPALGVAIALALTLLAERESGLVSGRADGDRVRLALAAILVVLAVPWLFAETGFYAPDPILADEVPAGEALSAVHLGHHHGTDGVLLALGALLLSRALAGIRHARLAAAASAYLALLLVYGVVNAVQDVWLEQVVKRGWADREIPSALRPELSPLWAVIVAGAVAVELLWFRRARGYARTSSSHSDIGT